MSWLVLVLVLFGSWVFFVTAKFTQQTKTKTNNVDSLTFLTIGDWGYRSSDQGLVARQMGTKATSTHAQFLVALGDNFFPIGVPTDTDPEWDDVYKNVFNNPSLSIPWFAVCGDRDHLTNNCQAQLDYYNNKRDSRWTMPSFWFNETVSFTTTDGVVVNINWLFLDTPLLVGEYNETSGTFSPPSSSIVEQQLAWFNESLAAASKQFSSLSSSSSSPATAVNWLFVAGHYPLYSAGEHGSSLPPLIEAIESLLFHYHVDAYFSAHDHSMQHLQRLSSSDSTSTISLMNMRRESETIREDEADGENGDADDTLNLFISGATALRGTVNKTPQTVFAVVDAGFGQHTVNATHMTTQFVNRLGKTLYTFAQAYKQK